MNAISGGRKATAFASAAIFATSVLDVVSTATSSGTEANPIAASLQGYGFVLWAGIRMIPALAIIVLVIFAKDFIAEHSTFFVVLSIPFLAASAYMVPTIVNNFSMI